MIPKLVFLIPALLQGCIMVVDEFHFHRRRGLPLWERIGHPIDTLVVFICYFCASFFPLTETFLGLFITLSVLSCLLITKDEFVHSLHCSAGELWLHSLLFILHPLCLLAAGWMWWQGGFETLMRTQALILFAFMSYQFIYWNILWKPQEAPFGVTPSTMTSMTN